jgi:hypothetical protein
MRGIRRVLWTFQIKHLTPTLINLETGEVTSKLGWFLTKSRHGEPWVSLKEYRAGNAVMKGRVFL